MQGLIIGLAVCRLLPFAVTQTILGAARLDSGARRRARILIPGTLLNLACNGTAAWFLTADAFGTEQPIRKIGEMLRLECTIQDAGTLAGTIPACLGVGIAAGFLLRILLCREDRLRIPRGRKAAVWLLSLACICGTIAGESAGANGAKALRITAVCRRAAAETGDVSYAEVTNPGELACDAGPLWLSETEEKSQAYALPEQRIPAGATARLTMDYLHGPDLRKTGGSTLFLTDGEGRELDRVTVPALEENQCWVRTDDGWEVRQIAETETEKKILPPVLGQAGGFYDAPFALEMKSAEGLAIRYTLDGSEPGADALLYTEPLRIQDASGEENRGSARTDGSAGFDKRYRVPEVPVDKCTVVRAACFDGDGNRSAVVTESYFVGFGEKTGYEGTKILSLATDPENLFGREKGIYVLGKTFEEEYDPETEKNGWWWWPANYHNKGREWERPAAVQLFSEDGETELHQDAGVRIKGGASAGLLPKGLNLYARKEYSEIDVFPADLFDTGYIAKRISLASGGNDTELKIKDWLVSRLAGDEGIPLAHYVPCSLFLNGEYWGVYWITEKLDAEYCAFLSGSKPELVNLVKNGTLRAGEEEDLEKYKKTVSYISKNDMSDGEKYRKACGMIDMEAFVTYMAIEIYSGNTDRTDKANNAAWRVQDEWTEKWGTWQWLLFDLNHVSAFQDSGADTMGDLMDRSKMFRSLMESEEFRHALGGKLRELAEGAFAPERAEAAIEEYQRILGAAVEKEHVRFYGKGLDGSLLEQVKEFVRNRSAYIDEVTTWLME